MANILRPKHVGALINKEKALCNKFTSSSTINLTLSSLFLALPCERHGSHRRQNIIHQQRFATG
jgi:hypothetical protein